MQHITHFDREFTGPREKMSPANFPAQFVCYPVMHSFWTTPAVSALLQQVDKLLWSDLRKKLFIPLAHPFA